MPKRKRPAGGKIDKCLNVIILVLVSFIVVYCSITLAARRDAARRGHVTVEQLAEAARGIKTYSAEVKCRRAPLAVFTDDEEKPERVFKLESDMAVVGEAGRRMRVDMKITSPVGRMRWQVVFDGTWQWFAVEALGEASAGKLRVSEFSPDPKKRPFQSPMKIQGAGLIACEDLPGTILTLLKLYDLNLLPASDQRVGPGEWVFAGKLRENELRRLIVTTQGREPASDELELAAELMQPALFRFSKKTLLLVGYQVGSSDDNPAVAVDITYRSVNKPLPRGTFTFVPPPGVEVKDTTAELVAQAKSNRHARRGRP